MNFSIEAGIKYHKDKDNTTDEDKMDIRLDGLKDYFCFFHAVQRIMQGERIEQEVYDTDDEYEQPRECKDCLVEETEARSV